MGIDKFWQLLLALPALLLTGITFAMPAGEGQVSAHSKTAVSTPPAVLGSATAKQMPTPKPTATPTSTTVPRAHKAVVAPPAAAPVSTAPGSEIATEQVCPGQSDTSKTAAVLTCLTSNARTFHGLPGISANGALMAAAVAKDQDMLSCGYGHTACGREFGYWMSNKGYAGRCTAENIAQGQKTPREVFVDWMNSAGHRANILNKDYRDIGVAVLASSGGPLWTMELGGC